MISAKLRRLEEKGRGWRKEEHVSKKGRKARTNEGRRERCYGEERCKKGMNMQDVRRKIKEAERQRDLRKKETEDSE